MAAPLPEAQRMPCRTFEQHCHITLCCRQIANFEYNHAGEIQCNTQRSQMIDSASVLNIVLGHTDGLIRKSLKPEDPRESATSCHQLVIVKSDDIDVRLGRGCRIAPKHVLEMTPRISQIAQVMQRGPEHALADE